MAPLSPGTLLSGALFALEQCGRMLEDAVILFERERPATAAGVALLAREEMGKHRLLLDLWRKAAAGDSVTAETVEAKCADHERKQTSGQSSVVYRADRDTEMGRLLQAGSGDPRTPGFREAREKLEQIDRRKRRRQPHDRHEQRLRAFYVDLAPSASSWLRPRDLPRSTCAETVTDAVNDYTGQWERMMDKGAIHNDRDLATAIEALPERIDLPRPRHIAFNIYFKGVDEQLIHDAIAGRAYSLFEQRGRKHGHDLEDWLQAESEQREL